MQRFSLLILALLTALPLAAQTSESDRFRRLLEQEWEWQLQQNPDMATRIGDKRYDDRLTDVSIEAIEKRRAHNRDLIRRIEGIDRSRLSAGDQINYDLFLRRARNRAESDQYPEDLIQITQRGGPHTVLTTIAQTIPRTSATDYENFIKRMQAYPRYVDQTIALLRRGLDEGVTPPRVVLRNVAELISNHITDDPTANPIYSTAFATMPSRIPAGEQRRLQRQAADAIRDVVTPANRRLHQFFVQEYLPRTREAIGLSALQRGKEWYAHRARLMTTTDRTPDEIHQLGLSEVRRIRAEMERVKESTGFRGTLAEFFEFLRTDPRFYYTTREDLLTGYREIAKRIDPELPKLFGTLPRLTYGVIPVPSHSEKTQTTAYYNQGSLESGRPGYFFANLYDLKSRPKWEMEALTLHEAVPGHHLQIALAQELPDVPKFRRFGFDATAFVEGWGLYAESLGPELGMYQDPYSKFGQLTYEMWRAIRLVVDTGMHVKGWTRDQAIQFFRENSSKPLHDIEVEIDRYLIAPGQALAYKLGELKFKELRELAERELGPRFDIRRFHDQLLAAGAIPLSMVEERTRSWIASQREGERKATITLRR